jgi:hypothetical protein
VTKLRPGQVTMTRAEVIFMGVFRCGGIDPSPDEEAGGLARWLDHLTRL